MKTPIRNLTVLLALTVAAACADPSTVPPQGAGDDPRSAAPLDSFPPDIRQAIADEQQRPSFQRDVILAGLENGEDPAVRPLFRVGAAIRARLCQSSESNACAPIDPAEVEAIIAAGRDCDFEGDCGLYISAVAETLWTLAEMETSDPTVAALIAAQGSAALRERLDQTRAFLEANPLG